MPYSSPTIEIPHSDLSTSSAFHEPLQGVAPIPAPVARGNLSLPKNDLAPELTPAPQLNSHLHSHWHSHSHPYSQNRFDAWTWGHYESSHTDMYGPGGGGVEHEAPSTPSLRSLTDTPAVDEAPPYTEHYLTEKGDDLTIMLPPSPPRTLSPPPIISSALPENLSDARQGHQRLASTPSSPLKSCLHSRSAGVACERSSPPACHHVPTRSASAPAKFVHFAAEDAVLLFCSSRRPSTLFSQIMEDSSATESEAEPSQASWLQFGDFNVATPFTTATRGSSRAASGGCHARTAAHVTGKNHRKIILSKTKSSPIPRKPGLMQQMFAQGNSSSKVHLESVCLWQGPYHSSGRGLDANACPEEEEHHHQSHHPVLHGTILVENICFEKTVCIRFSLDEWRTVNEVGATWDSGVPESVGRWDRFEFNINLSSVRNLVTRRLLVAVCYNALCQEGGGEYWDNNAGLNFCFGFESELLIPQRSTGTCAFDSDSRHQNVPHLPLTNLTLRKTSTFPHLFATGLDAHNDAAAYYRSLHLRLSNYVSPHPHTHPSPLHPPPQRNPESASPSDSELPPKAVVHSDRVSPEAHGHTLAVAPNPSLSCRLTPVSILLTPPKSGSPAQLTRSASTTRASHSRLPKFYHTLPSSCRAHSPSSTFIPAYTE